MFTCQENAVSSETRKLKNYFGFKMFHSETEANLQRNSNPKNLFEYFENSNDEAMNENVGYANALFASGCADGSYKNKIIFYSDISNFQKYNFLDVCFQAIMQQRIRLKE